MISILLLSLSLSLSLSLLLLVVEELGLTWMVVGYIDDTMIMLFSGISDFAWMIFMFSAAAAYID